MSIKERIKRVPVFGKIVKQLYRKIRGSHSKPEPFPGSEENEGYSGTHIKHRKFTKWVREKISNFKLIEYIPNKYPYEGDYRQGSFADFYLYEKI